MVLYSGIDLHGNNNATLLLDDQGRVIYQKRLPNQLPTILEQLAPYQADIKGVVVESTYIPKRSVPYAIYYENGDIWSTNRLPMY